MILSYDTDRDMWTLLCPSDKYFYNTTSKEPEKIRNLIAEFPSILTDMLKNVKYKIDIRQERFSRKKGEEYEQCRWVEFEIHIGDDL